MLKPAKDILSGLVDGPGLLNSVEPDEILITKRQTKKAELIQLVREQRNDARQDLSFQGRPFVLCGLPIQRPKAGQLLHVRRNGQYVLEITGHPKYGLPWGIDRLIPIWIATLAIRQGSQTVRFKAAMDICREFDLNTGGRTYERLVDGFKRVFGATIFFGTADLQKNHVVWETQRYNYFDDLKLWYSRKDKNNPSQSVLDGGDFDNVVRLSDAFWRELQEHGVPIERNAIRALSNAPGPLDLYMWLTFRCHTAKRQTLIPLFGRDGLTAQLGSEEMATKAKFRQSLKRWLEQVRELWPDCPAEVDETANYLVLGPGRAVTTRGAGGVE